MNTKYEQEIPKYLKQKESNTSKANKKSKHKHHYEECLIQYHYNWYKEHEKYKASIGTSLCSYCTACGKIGNRFKNSIVTDYERKEIINGKTFYLVISGGELYERYHDKLNCQILCRGYI